MEEDAIKDTIYSSVDRGLFVSYFAGGFGSFAVYQTINGNSWWIIIAALSLLGFFTGRYMALKFLFDQNIECGIGDVDPLEEEEG